MSIENAVDPSGGQDSPGPQWRVRSASKTLASKGACLSQICASAPSLVFWALVFSPLGLAFYSMYR